MGSEIENVVFIGLLMLIYDMVINYMVFYVDGFEIGLNIFVFGVVIIWFGDGVLVCYDEFIEILVVDFLEELIL